MRTILTKRDCDRIRMNVEGLGNASDAELQALIDSEDEIQAQFEREAAAAV